MTVDTACPSVFDAGLPTLDYDLETTPAQLYPRLLAAQQKAPIALGPFGPKYFRTSSCALSFVTAASRSHPASTSPPRASRLDRSTTRSSTRFWAWKDLGTSAPAASCPRPSRPARSSACTPRSSTSSTNSSNPSAAKATATNGICCATTPISLCPPSTRRCATPRSPAPPCGSPPKTSSSPASSSPPQPCSSRIPLRPTAIPRSTTTPTASTSPARDYRRS